MSRVIVFASGKGGTGKSSVCVGLAISLVKNHNKVLLIDCDFGMRGLDLLLGIDGKLVFDASDIVRGNCSYKAAVYEQSKIKGLFLLPAPLDVENEISSGVMKQLVNEIKSGYDYVLIDSPAGVGTSFLSAASAADMAFVVINSEPTGIRGCENVRVKLKSLGITNIRLIINKFNEIEFRSLNVYKDLDEVIDLTKIQLIGLVPEDYKYANMLHHGCNSYVPTLAGAAFDSIAARIEGEKVPLSVRI